MDGNWWIITETLKAREKEVAALYQRYWYPRVDESAARRRAAAKSRLTRTLSRLLGLTRAPQAALPAGTCPCGEHKLACG